MSEQTPPGDETKNLKAEMDRKLSNIQTDMKKSSDALAAQLAALSAKLEPKTPTKSKTEEDKELELEVWDNPAAFKERILKEADQLAEQKVSGYLQQQQQATQQLSELYSIYPELQQNGHVLATRSVEIFNSMPSHEKGSPSAFKLAVSQAASENGIKPLSKREEHEMDDFSLKASGKTRKTAPKIPKNTELFAQAMGVDLSDEKIRKQVEAYSAYTPQEWQRWK